MRQAKEQNSARGMRAWSSPLCVKRELIHHLISLFSIISETISGNISVIFGRLHCMSSESSFIISDYAFKIFLMFVIMIMAHFLVLIVFINPKN